MNTIMIHDLRLPIIVGWPESERQHPQIISLNIEIDVSSHQSHVSDHVQDTVNYDEILMLMKELTASTTWKLLEKLSRDLATEILNHFPRTLRAKVALRKNIFNDARGVTVSYECSREAS